MILSKKSKSKSIKTSSNSNLSKTYKPTKTILLLKINLGIKLRNLIDRIRNTRHTEP